MDNTSPQNQADAVVPRFNAGAVAKYAHWARVFIDRYFEYQGKPLSKESETYPATILVDKLKLIANKAYEISQLAEEEQQAAFGEFIFNNERKVTQALASAYLFASMASRHAPLLAKEETPIEAEVEKMEINQTNLEKLMRGLKASLVFSGSSYGALKKSNRRASIRLEGGKGPESLFPHFKMVLAPLFGNSSTSPICEASRTEAVGAYLGGFQVGSGRGNAARIAKFPDAPLPG